MTIDTRNIQFVKALLTTMWNYSCIIYCSNCGRHIRCKLNKLHWKRFKCLHKSIHALRYFLYLEESCYIIVKLLNSDRFENRIWTKNIQNSCICFFIWVIVYKVRLLLSSLTCVCCYCIEQHSTESNIHSHLATSKWKCALLKHMRTTKSVVTCKQWLQI